MIKALKLLQQAAWRHQTWNWVIGSPGQWVMWVIFHVRVTGSSFWLGVRLEFFQFSKKCPKCKTYIWNAEMTKSHSQVSVVGLKSLDVSPCNELLLLPMIIKNSLAWKYFFTHKSTFVVHYRRGLPGQLGLRVAGFPGHWVAGSQNVIQFHLWKTRAESGLAARTASIRRRCVGVSATRERRVVNLGDKKSSSQNSHRHTLVPAAVSRLVCET